MTRLSTLAPEPTAEPSVPAGANHAAAAEGQTPAVLPEMVQTAFDYMPATLAGIVAGVGMISVLFWSQTTPAVMLPWMAAFAALWLMRLLMLQRFRRAQARPPEIGRAHV